MLVYIIKRILIFIPTIVAISLLTFVLSTNAPGDPVEDMLSSQTDQGQAAGLLANEKEYLALRKKLGLDLPIFYFSLSNTATPDTLHRLPKRLHKQNLERLIYDYGNWAEISAYYYSLKDLELASFEVVKDSTNRTELIKIKDAISSLFLKSEDKKIQIDFTSLEQNVSASPSLADVKSKFESVKSSYAEMIGNPTRGKYFTPTMHFYGTENQYHRWFFGDKPWFRSVEEGSWTSAGFIRGDFGISYKDRRPVGGVIMDALRWTIPISLISIFLTYLISIPVGVSSALNKDMVNKFKARPIWSVLVFDVLLWLGLAMIPIPWFVSVLIIIAVKLFLLKEKDFFLNKKVDWSLIKTGLIWVLATVLIFMAFSGTFSVLRANGNLFIAIALSGVFAFLFNSLRNSLTPDEISTTVLFILYSLPSFWIATMGIVYLCGGDFYDIFPPTGVSGDLSEDASLWEWIVDTTYHLILPLICWTYSSFAYLSRQMRGGMLAVLGQDFIRTARAKGLPEDKVIWKHAMRNSLLPIITLFANVFPLAISGGLVLEIIFNIPGMGKVGYEAVVARNYPIVFTVMMFAAIMTLVGYLVSDILYAIVDPRISYSSKK